MAGTTSPWFNPNVMRYMAGLMETPKGKIKSAKTMQVQRAAQEQAQAQGQQPPTDIFNLANPFFAPNPYLSAISAINQQAPSGDMFAMAGLAPTPWFTTPSAQTGLLTNAQASTSAPAPAKEATTLPSAALTPPPINVPTVSVQQTIVPYEKYFSQIAPVQIPPVPAPLPSLPRPEPAPINPFLGALGLIGALASGEPMWLMPAFQEAAGRTQMALQDWERQQAAQQAEEQRQMDVWKTLATLESNRWEQELTNAQRLYDIAQRAATAGDEQLNRAAIQQAQMNLKAGIQKYVNWVKEKINDSQLKQQMLLKAFNFVTGLPQDFQAAGLSVLFPLMGLPSSLSSLASTPADLIRAKAYEQSVMQTGETQRAMLKYKQDVLQETKRYHDAVLNMQLAREKRLATQAQQLKPGMLSDAQKEMLKIQWMEIEMARAKAQAAQQTYNSLIASKKDFMADEQGRNEALAQISDELTAANEAYKTALNKLEDMISSFKGGMGAGFSMSMPNGTLPPFTPGQMPGGFLKFNMSPVPTTKPNTKSNMQSKNKNKNKINEIIARKLGVEDLLNQGQK